MRFAKGQHVAVRATGRVGRIVAISRDEPDTPSDDYEYELEFPDGTTAVHRAVALTLRPGAE